MTYGFNKTALGWVGLSLSPLLSLSWTGLWAEPHLWPEASETDLGWAGLIVIVIVGWAGLHLRPEASETEPTL